MTKEEEVKAINDMINELIKIAFDKYLRETYPNLSQAGLNRHWVRFRNNLEEDKWR